MTHTESVPILMSDIDTFTRGMQIYNVILSTLLVPVNVTGSKQLNFQKKIMYWVEIQRRRHSWRIPFPILSVTDLLYFYLNHTFLLHQHLSSTNV